MTCVEVQKRQSEIEGLGTFAVKSIKARSILWSDPTCAEMRYVNHSDQPNAVLLYRGFCLVILAIRNIRADEEITADYDAEANYDGSSSLPSDKRFANAISTWRETGSRILLDSYR